MSACWAATVSSRFPLPAMRIGTLGRCCLQVSGDVLEVIDALPGARVRQLGGLEFLAHVARAEAEFEAAVAEVIDGGRIASQQRRLVEAGVEHVGPHPHGGRGRRKIAVSTGNGAGAPMWSGR